MNYHEKYELQFRPFKGKWGPLEEFGEEKWALERLELESREGSGSWRVVRISEVTVASVIKA